MAPIDSAGIDAAVSSGGQVAATVVTFAISVAIVASVIALCRRDRIAWPLLALVSGGLTFLVEPIYDLLFGLWFFAEGQWHLLTVYGIHLPIWLPAIYVAYYGGGAVFVARRLERGASGHDVLRIYGVMVVLAILAEELYINAFEVYNYQTHQPFLVFGYPLFVAFVNSVPPVLAGIVYFRLVPALRGWEKIALVAVVPACFAANAFGNGVLYLTVRHASSNPSTVLLYAAALVAVAGSVGIIVVALRLALGRQPLSTDRRTGDGSTPEAATEAASR